MFGNKINTVQPYEKLADIYNYVMSHVDYGEWMSHIHSLCKKHNIVPDITVDISCGTGNSVPYLLSWCGILYCADLSLDMVRNLNKDYPEMHGRIWISEMSRLPLGKQVGLILNLQDSVNYYTDTETVRRHLEHIYTHLYEGGAYIFDLATEYNITRNFLGLYEVYEDEHFGYERINNYSKREMINTTEFYIWFDENGEKQQFREEHIQRMYTLREIETCLEGSPFQEWHLYGDETLEEADNDTERVHIVALRVKS